MSFWLGILRNNFHCVILVFAGQAKDLRTWCVTFPGPVPGSSSTDLEKAILHRNLLVFIPQAGRAVTFESKSNQKI